MGLRFGLVLSCLCLKYIIYTYILYHFWNSLMSRNWKASWAQTRKVDRMWCAPMLMYSMSWDSPLHLLHPVAHLFWCPKSNPVLLLPRYKPLLWRQPSAQRCPLCQPSAPLCQASAHRCPLRKLPLKRPLFSLLCGTLRLPCLQITNCKVLFEKVHWVRERARNLFDTDMRCFRPRGNS